MSKPSISRRDFLKRGGAGLASATLWPAGTKAAAPALVRRQTDLVLSFGPDDTGTLQPLLDAFNRDHPDIRVTRRVMARESDAYYRQLESDFTAGADDIDVIGADVVWTAAFARNGWVRDLSRRFHSAYDPEDFVEAALNSVVYRFKVFGVPWYTDAGVLFYRKDLLEQNGFSTPPRTWGDLKQTARAVMQNAGTRYGFVFQGAEYEGGVANALEYIWNAGGRVLTGNLSVAGSFGQVVMDPNVITVNTAEAAAGLDTARSMVAEGLTPAAVTTYNEQNAWGDFMRGDAVFMRNWPANYAVVTDPAQAQLTPEQVGLARLPTDTATGPFSCLGGWNLMVNANIDRSKRDAAWTLIRYLTDPARQKRRALDGSFLPSLRSLYDDPQILQQVPAIALGKAAIDDTRIRPVSPFYMQIAPRIARAFNRTLRGDTTGTQAVDALQRELQTILRKNR